MLISLAVSTPHLHTKEPAIDWHAQDFQEFVPQSFEGQMVRKEVSYCPPTPTLQAFFALSSHDRIAWLVMNVRTTAHTNDRVTQVLATIHSTRQTTFLALQVRATKLLPLTHMLKMPRQRIIRTPALFRLRHIICTGLLALSLQDCSPTSALHTISLSQTQ